MSEAVEEGSDTARAMAPITELRAAADAMTAAAALLDEMGTVPWAFDPLSPSSARGSVVSAEDDPDLIAGDLWRDDALAVVHRRNTTPRDAAVLRATADWLLDVAHEIAFWEAERDPSDTSEITHVHALAVARAFTAGTTTVADDKESGTAVESVAPGTELLATERDLALFGDGEHYLAGDARPPQYRVEAHIPHCTDGRAGHSRPSFPDSGSLEQALTDLKTYKRENPTADRWGIAKIEYLARFTLVHLEPAEDHDRG